MNMVNRLLDAELAPAWPTVITGDAAAVARAAAAAAWSQGAPPPRHWTTSSSTGYDLGPVLGEGARKKALTVVGRPDVLVKTRVRTSAHKVRSELATRSEVMYLELNRGRRGVPRLYGGWRGAAEDRVCPTRDSVRTSAVQLRGHSVEAEAVPLSTGEICILMTVR